MCAMHLVVVYSCWNSRKVCWRRQRGNQKTQIEAAWW